MRHCYETGSTTTDGSKTVEPEAKDGIRKFGPVTTDCEKTVEPETKDGIKIPDMTGSEEYLVFNS